ncbi:hypothetical protein HanIR_Chr16g0845201 [Helianthus annuus]|nr:hypothetical protein HanIR_Chr16g0845201 [Helianthus annuus]
MTSDFNFKSPLFLLSIPVIELYICDCVIILSSTAYDFSQLRISLNFSSMALSKVTLISDLDVLLETYKLKVKIILRK